MDTVWPSFSRRLAKWRPRNACPPPFVLMISALSALAAMRMPAGRLPCRLHATLEPKTSARRTEQVRMVWLCMARLPANTRGRSGVLGGLQPLQATNVQTIW